MTTMNANFQYIPLYRPNDQIRLLTIHPGPRNSPLECTLDIVHLTPDPPRYIAISYTWGPPTPSTTVTINNQPMVIRQSCTSALLTMRFRHDMFPVWIDAICINQADNHERNFQVGIMGTIYHLAESVAACLQCDDSLAMSRNLYPLVLTDPDEKRGFECWQAAVHALLGNPYFTRMWIVQEISLAHRLQLYAGGDVMDWSELETQAYNSRGWMLSLRYPPGSDPERAFKDLADTCTQIGTHEKYAHLQKYQTLTLTG